MGILRYFANIPIFTTVFAILLLHDTLSLIQIIGGIIAIVGGIIVVSGEAFPKRLAGVSRKNRTEQSSYTTL